MLYESIECRRGLWNPISGLWAELCGCGTATFPAPTTDCTSRVNIDGLSAPGTPVTLTRGVSAGHNAEASKNFALFCRFTFLFERPARVSSSIPPDSPAFQPSPSDHTAIFYVAFRLAVDPQPDTAKVFRSTSSAALLKDPLLLTRLGEALRTIWSSTRKRII